MKEAAYELRISDWRSDVCSSDLRHQRGAPHRILPGPFALLRRQSRLALLFRALGGAVLPVHAYRWHLSALRQILPAFRQDRVAEGVGPNNSPAPLAR